MPSFRHRSAGHIQILTPRRRHAAGLNRKGGLWMPTISGKWPASQVTVFCGSRCAARRVIMQGPAVCPRGGAPQRTYLASECPASIIAAFAEMGRITSFFARGFISTMWIRHRWPERACQPRPEIELHRNGRLGQALPEEGADVDVGYTSWWRQRGMREKGPCWVGLWIHSNGMLRSGAKA